MAIVIAIFFVLAIGIFIGFMIGFSRSMKEAAMKLHGEKRGVPAWALRVFGSIGCILLVVALGVFVSEMIFLRSAVNATGIITELKPSKDSDGHVTYAPVFTFEDGAGKKHTVNSKIGTSLSEFQVGDRIPVLYSGKDPESAKINGFIYVWGASVFIGAIGICQILFVQVLKYWLKMIEKFKARKNTAAANA